MKSSKIDWSNHLVAFFSSLLGILIAFQLQNYADDRAEQEKIKTTMQSINKEIEQNLSIYQYNADTLAEWISYVDFYFAHNRPGVRGLVLTGAQFDSLRQKNPARYANIKTIKPLDGTFSSYDIPILVNVSPRTGISTSNWEAARSSGVVNLLDHSTAASLTEIYYWFDINLGQGDADFYRMLVNKGEIDNLTEVRDYYKTASSVARLKKQHIEKIVAQVNWD